MSAIDTKLDIILELYLEKERRLGNKGLRADSIAQIKQVFADEGWMPAPISIEFGSTIKTHGKTYLSGLSGQEWYDRFKKLILGGGHQRAAKRLATIIALNRSNPGDIIDEEILKLAKKAAGLE